MSDVDDKGWPGERGYLYDLHDVEKLEITDINPNPSGGNRYHRLIFCRGANGKRFYLHLYATDPTALIIEGDDERFEEKHNGC